MAKPKILECAPFPGVLNTEPLTAAGADDVNAYSEDALVDEIHQHRKSTGLKCLDDNLGGDVVRAAVNAPAATARKAAKQLLITAADK